MHKKLLFICILTAFTILIPASVFANGLPAKEPKGQYGLVPDKNSNISVNSETIEFNVGENCSSSEITVTYELINNEKRKKSTYIAFFIPYDVQTSDNLTAALNGKNLNIDMSKRFNYDSVSFELKETAREAVFAAKLDPESKNTLQIKYMQISGEEQPYDSDFYFPVKQFYYYLAPAKSWASYKDLRITINIPKNYNLLNSDKFIYEGISDNKKKYTAHFENIPRDILWVKLNNGGIFGLNTKKDIRLLIFITIFTAGLLFGLFIRLQAVRKARPAVITAYFSVIIILLTFISPYHGILLHVSGARDFTIYILLSLVINIAGIAVPSLCFRYYFSRFNKPG